MSLYNNNLKNLYNKHRRCLVKERGQIFEICPAARMTLGFEKASKCIEFSEIGNCQNVMNIFSGAGGILRLLSIQSNIKFLIGLDILYEGLLPSPTGWFYASREAFDEWKNDAEKIGLNVKEPFFLQSDVRLSVPGFYNSMDAIIIDPPYGVVSDDILGISENNAKNIYLSSIITSLKYLIRGGKATAIIPKSWIEDTKILAQAKSAIIEDTLEILGKFDLVIIRIKKI